MRFLKRVAADVTPTLIVTQTTNKQATTTLSTAPVEPAIAITNETATAAKTSNSTTRATRTTTTISTLPLKRGQPGAAVS
jgi:hypothetical protein